MIRKKSTPTITLAELYESQNHLMDALLIYKYLKKDNPSKEIVEKIDKLENKVFSEIESQYLSVIQKIFTPEECKFFQILPHAQFLEFKKIIQQDKYADIEFDKLRDEKENR